MQIIVSARHFELNDPLRETVEERLRRLSRFESRLSRAEITLLDGKNRCEVEARAKVEHEGFLHAEAVGPDFRTAVDRVVDKLGRQLRRRHSRRRDHQANLKGFPSPSEGLEP